MKLFIGILIGMFASVIFIGFRDFKKFLLEYRQDEDETREHR